MKEKKIEETLKLKQYFRILETFSVNESEN